MKAGYSSTTISLIFALGCFGVVAAGVTDEERLIDKLFTGYKKEARPVTNSSVPVYVTITLAIYQLLEVNNRQQTITFSGAVQQAWQDPRLRWKPADYGNTYGLLIPAENIWRPDVGLSTGITDLFDLSEKTRNKALILDFVNFHSIWWSVIKVFKNTCRMDLSYFPFDRQKCNLRFNAVFGFTNLIHLMTVPKVDLQYYAQNDAWDLVEAKGQVLIELVPSIQTNISVYSVDLVLQRRTTYYWIHLIIPCMFISVLVTFVFVMPADAGEKISFSVTILLAFTVYQLIIADSLPRGSTSVSVMSTYLTALVTLSAVSVILSIIILNVHHRDPKVPLPRHFRTLVFGILARGVCMRSLVPKDDQVTPVVSATVLTNTAYQGKTEDAVSAITDGSDKPPRPSIAEQALQELLQIRLLLSGQPRKRAEDTEADDRNDWKLAAAILDRFFLLFYVIVTGIINIVLLCMPALAAQAQADAH